MPEVDLLSLRAVGITFAKFHISHPGVSWPDGHECSVEEVYRPHKPPTWGKPLNGDMIDLYSISGTTEWISPHAVREK